MVRFTKSMLSVGLVIAAVASGTVAGGARAQDVKVAVGDLDLTSAQGLHMLNARVEAAADQVCSDTPVTGSIISRRNACVQALSSQVFQGLSPLQQDQIRSAARQSREEAEIWPSALSAPPKAPT